MEATSAALRAVGAGAALGCVGAVAGGAPAACAAWKASLSLAAAAAAARGPCSRWLCSYLRVARDSSWRRLARASCWQLLCTGYGIFFGNL
jgi:hypothetical protein